MVLHRNVGEYFAKGVTGFAALYGRKDRRNLKKPQSKDWGFFSTHSSFVIFI
jgi:hypothetical protein